MNIIKIGLFLGWLIGAFAIIKGLVEVDAWLVCLGSLLWIIENSLKLGILKDDKMSNYREDVREK